VVHGADRQLDPLRIRRARRHVPLVVLVLVDRGDVLLLGDTAPHYMRRFTWGMDGPVQVTAGQQECSVPVTRRHRRARDRELRRRLQLLPKRAGLHQPPDLTVGGLILAEPLGRRAWWEAVVSLPLPCVVPEVPAVGVGLGLSLLPPEDHHLVVRAAVLGEGPDTHVIEPLGEELHHVPSPDVLRADQSEYALVGQERGRCLDEAGFHPAQPPADKVERRIDPREREAASGDAASQEVSRGNGVALGHSGADGLASPLVQFPMLIHLSEKS